MNSSSVSLPTLFRNGVLLGLVTIVGVGVIVLIANLTRDHIAREQADALNRSLLEVMPPDRIDNRPAKDRVMLETDSLLGTTFPMPAYIARKDSSVSGVILQVSAPEGYGGAIKLLVGVDNSGTITGVRVIPPHNETLGLGDYIERRKSDWILGFNGKSLANTSQDRWRVKKDGGEFDAVAGATITPRAVVDAVHKALLYVNEHKESLLPAPLSGAALPASTTPETVQPTTPEGQPEAISNGN